MSFQPLFDMTEAERVARRVGFDPRRSGPAQECFLETQKYWSLPNNMTGRQKYNAHFFLALGLFIWVQYGKNDEPIPSDIEEWHEVNTALASADALYVEVGK